MNFILPLMHVFYACLMGFPILITVIFYKRIENLINKDQFSISSVRFNIYFILLSVILCALLLIFIFNSFMSAVVTIGLFAFTNLFFFPYVKMWIRENKNKYKMD